MCDNIGGRKYASDEECNRGWFKRCQTETTGVTADGGAPGREEPSMLDAVVKAGLPVEGSAPHKMPEDDDVPGVSADGGTL